MLCLDVKIGLKIRLHVLDKISISLLTIFHLQCWLMMDIKTSIWGDCTPLQAAANKMSADSVVGSLRWPMNFRTNRWHRGNAISLCERKKMPEFNAKLLLSLSKIQWHLHVTRLKNWLTGVREKGKARHATRVPGVARKYGKDNFKYKDKKLFKP